MTKIRGVATVIATVALCFVLGLAVQAGQQPDGVPPAGDPGATPPAGAVQPADSPEPTEPVKPGTPSEPGIPTNPGAPSDPGAPVEPEAPTEPETPVEPGAPTEPVEPVEPTEPMAPIEPTPPETPAGPVKPTTPAKPETPDKPEPPAEPETPAEPTPPATPAEPAKPTEPTPPAAPETPETPEADPDASVGAAAATDTPKAAPATEAPAIDPAAEPDASADEDAAVLAGRKNPTGWQEIGGKWYYYNKDGSVATGSFEAGGHRYYADKSGARQTGLIKAGGLGYLYANSDGVLGKGWHDTTYGSYYFGDNYAAVTGWQEVDGAARWFDPATGMTKQGIVQDGEDYYFHSRGVAAEHLGFWYEGGYNYYFGNPGAAAYKGVFNIGSDYFFAFPDATVRSGLMWDYDADGLRYGDVNTLYLAQSEWVSVKGKGRYYFDGDGLALGGDQVVNGVNCYFDPETYIAAQGIVQREDGNYYYYDKGKNNAYGFVYTGGYNYYFGAPGGPAYTGLFSVGAESFYAFPDGTIRSGLMWDTERDGLLYGDPGTLWLAKGEWVKLDTGSYYFGGDALALKGRHVVDGKSRHFNEVTCLLESDEVYMLFLDDNNVPQQGCLFGSASGRDHRGIDVSTKGDPTIFATVSGTVRWSRAVAQDAPGWGRTWEWGWFVWIDAADGTRHIYAHCEAESLRVQEGQKVQAGQAIATMGETGYSFGKHVHYEVRNSGNTAIDPTPYCGLKNKVGSTRNTARPGR